MTRAYSVDLRERVAHAVKQEGLLRRQAAERFNVGISTAILWLLREKATGSVAPAKMGGYKPRKIRGEHHDWLVSRCRDGSAFTMAKPPLPRFPGDGVLRGSLFAIHDLGIRGVPELRFGA